MGMLMPPRPRAFRSFGVLIGTCGGGPVHMAAGGLRDEHSAVLARKRPAKWVGTGNEGRGDENKALQRTIWQV